MWKWIYGGIAVYDIYNAAKAFLLGNMPLFATYGLLAIFFLYFFIREYKKR